MPRPKPDWLKPLFPWGQKSLTVNGRRMAYIDEGNPQGRPVLLLSGNPTWGFLYRDFVEPLRQAGYRAIAPDWIGAGYSDHPPWDAALTFAHHVADLASLIDQLDLHGFVVVAQDWGGPQGVGAALQRLDRVGGLVLMNTWLFTGMLSKFHSSARPWATWHTPLIGQFFMKRLKVLSQHGPSAISVRGMSEIEARAYHHVFDEPDSDTVVLTWPRTIPMRQGDRGWADMKHIEERLAELSEVPVCLLWAPGDNVFPIEFAHRIKEMLPHAEGPAEFDRARHFLQDDRGPDLARAIVEFLDRRLGVEIEHNQASAPQWSPPKRAPGSSAPLSFVDPSAEELALLRADPLLTEQELDVRPEVAEAIERAAGRRSGRAYWRSGHGRLYALELGDLGRGRPSTATVYGFWDRYEPRPPEHEIDLDLLAFCTWIAGHLDTPSPSDVAKVARYAGVQSGG